jgi:hypothetical protein
MGSSTGGSMHVGSTPCLCIGTMLGRKNISGIPPIHTYEGEFICTAPNFYYP